MNLEKLNKYARLAIEVGVNLQKGQLLMINSPVDCKEFTRMLVENAYKVGASDVIVRWNDDIIGKYFYDYASMEKIKEIPNYLVEQMKYVVENNAAVVSISAPTPGLLKDVEPEKLQARSKASHEKLSFYQKHMMANGE